MFGSVWVAHTSWRNRAYLPHPMDVETGMYVSSVGESSGFIKLLLSFVC